MSLNIIKEIEALLVDWQTHPQAEYIIVLPNHYQNDEPALRQFRLDSRYKPDEIGIIKFAGYTVQFAPYMPGENLVPQFVKLKTTAQYPIYKPMPPANPELAAAIGEITRQISEAAHEIRNLGLEPFVEYIYGDDGLAKNIIVRPRRDDDHQVSNFSFPIK